MGGRPKALLHVDGRPMAGRVASALGRAGADDVVLVGGDAGWADQLGFGHVPDRWPGAGPLAGLATVLLAAADRPGVEVVVVAGCDQPWLDAAVLGRLAARLSGASPEGSACPPAAVGVQVGERRQLLPSAWRTSTGPALAELVEAGVRRLDAAASAAEVGWELVPAGVVADVDEPADLPPS